MSGPWVAVLTIIGALAGSGGLVAYFGTRLTNRTTRESSFMDQQQEDIATLKADFTKLQNEHRLLQDYVQTLRQYIADENPPPPPPWPPALTGGPW